MGREIAYLVTVNYAVYATLLQRMGVRSPLVHAIPVCEITAR